MGWSCRKRFFGRDFLFFSFGAPAMYSLQPKIFNKGSVSIKEINVESVRGRERGVEVILGRT